MRIRCVNIGRLLQIAVMGINILAFSFLYGFIIRIYADDGVTDFFDVKPGQVNVYEKQWMEYTCTFEYQAQGGTHEQWQVSMQRDEDGYIISCAVERGQTSYLYFQNFKMSIDGPDVRLRESQAINTGDKALAPEEYKFDFESNSLTSVPGSFKNHLEKVFLLATVGRGPEL